MEKSRAENEKAMAGAIYPPLAIFDEPDTPEKQGLFAIEDVTIEEDGEKLIHVRAVEAITTRGLKLTGKSIAVWEFTITRVLGETA